MEWNDIDRMAAPRRDVNAVTNITEACMDSSKINAMRLLGCDEKYKNGQASDYELLAEWERLLPLCRGTGAAALYEKECERLGIRGLETAEKWKKGNEALLTADFPKDLLPKDQITLGRFVSEFARETADRKSGFSDLSDALKKEAEAWKTKELHLVVELPDSPFIRPNPYAAEQAYLRILRDGKYKDEDACLILTQLVISLAIAPPKDKRLILHLYGKGGYGTSFDFLSYLNERGLYEGRVMLGIFLDSAPGAYDRLCAFSSERITLRPELILTVPDFADGLAERLRALFRLYPIGAVSFGGVLTDSPMYFVAHEILRESGV